MPIRSPKTRPSCAAYATAPGVSATDARRNGILAALPEADLKRWLPQLDSITLPLGHVMYESGKLETHVFFPTSALVSLLYVMKNGDSAESAVVGNEGVAGFSPFMGGDSTTIRAIVRSAGDVLRMPAGAITAEFHRDIFVRHCLLSYMQALITQMVQTAVCNRHCLLSQQLCRWLLLSLDRLPGNELEMTQELIANMLGVRREGVTEVAHKLQEAGLIRYARGHITVLDRQGLAQRACECYAVVKGEYDRLLRKPEASGLGLTPARAFAILREEDNAPPSSAMCADRRSSAPRTRTLQA